MPDDLELANLHARALFTHDAGSRLLFVNEPDNASAPAPRLFLARTRSGNVWRFRAGLPEELCDELSALCAAEPPPGAEPFEPRHLEDYVRLLERHAPVREVSGGPAYRFTRHDAPSKPLLTVTEDDAEVLGGGFEKLIEELPAWQPFVALVVEGRAVSVCRSVRITAEAHEAGVETLPDFRGRGYAREVVAEWARLVLAAGAIPLYSTDWGNKSSQALARKLHLERYAAAFQIT